MPVAERIQIDTASIPDSVRDNLAAATLECFKAFLQIPGNAEWLDQRIAARKAAPGAPVAALAAAPAVVPVAANRPAQ